MRTRRPTLAPTLASLAGALWLALATVHGASGAAAQGLDRLARGPAVGAPIPHPLSARDHAGAARDFGSVAGERGLILLFSRSLDWCVYCKGEAVAWNRRLGDVESLGYRVAIITYDGIEDLARFAERRKIGYTLLSDPKSEIIRAFGLLNETYPPGSYAHGVPHPIIFVVDAEGVIRHRFSGSNYSERPEIDAVLDAIRPGARRGAEG